MKIITQNVLLFFLVFVGLSSFPICPEYCSFVNTAYEGSGEAGICNASDQAGAKESSLPVKKVKRSKQPNILLIGVETLRADHVRCLGYSRNTTPTLDNLAKEGVLFSRAIATSSWTMPATMSVFTSFYPGVHKTTDYQKKLPEGRITIAEILKNNGYTTVAFVSNPTLDNRFGFSRGFDLYDDFSVWLDFVGMDKLVGSPIAVPNPDVHQILTNEPLTRAALRWIELHRQEPFFMFVFYFDPHYEYIPPPPFDTMFDPNYDGSIDGRGIVQKPRRSNRPPQRDLDHIIALYDGEIRYTDTYVSELLDAFARFGILDQTLVVIFGDHGDEFYEHSRTGHAHTLYNELIHIPLILRLPSKIPKGKRIAALTSQVDIMPTILDYLGIQHQQAMQGSSLRPLIEGREDKLHDLVYAEVSISRNKIISTAMSKDNKFILELNTGKKQLFDLNSDPDEQVNIYKEQSSNGPVSLESHLSLWLEYNDRLAEKLSGGKHLQKVELDENRLRQLKALGYIQ